LSNTYPMALRKSKHGIVTPGTTPTIAFFLHL
jgi:hypothetical protein